MFSISRLKNYSWCRFLFPAAALVFFLAPVFASAQTTGLVKCGLVYVGAASEQKLCTMCDIFKLVQVVTNFLIVYMAAPVAALVFAYGGFLLLTPGGSADKAKRGKTAITNAVVGLVIIYVSWLAVDAIMKAFAAYQYGAPQPTFGFWNKLECTAPTPPEITPPPTPTPTPGPVGLCTGKSCSDSGVNTCAANPSANCHFSDVMKWDSTIRSAVVQAGDVCGAVITTKLVKAIMSQESGGNPKASSGVAFGLMQLTIATANQFKVGCTDDTITSAWLLDEKNAKAQICIAIKAMRATVGACGCSVRTIAAGYNGGAGSRGACATSANCGQGAGKCKVCEGQQGPTMKWECLWDDDAHQMCNADRAGTSFSETRKYVPKVMFCYDRF